MEILKKIALAVLLMFFTIGCTEEEIDEITDPIDAFIEENTPPGGTGTGE